jgi:hypothetical protein
MNAHSAILHPALKVRYVTGFTSLDRLHTLAILVHHQFQTAFRIGGFYGSG